MQTFVKELFDKVANDYDRQRRKLIPCFDDFYGVALSLVETPRTSPDILDLGAGTGLFSSMVLQKYPNARMTLVDISEKMLEKARERFHRSGRIRYVVGDYANLEFSQSYDAVISSLSIHHLTHEAKKQLFANVYRILNDEGIFVNADQVKGNSPEIDHYFRRRWLDYIHAGGLTKAEIEASVERRKLDINATLADQIRWMEEAGFREVDCMYKYMDFAVFFGRKRGK
jgi:tRNA (cmo5U34)-methyltransferase